VAAGGSQNVTVTFAPTAVQSYSGTVTVASDKTSGTDTIAASGTGTGAVPPGQPGGTITTVAGSGLGFSGDGGPATAAKMRQLWDVAVDDVGNLYIADVGNDCVWKVTAATGIITIIAGNGTSGFSGDDGAATVAQLDSPGGVAVDGSGNVYIADRYNHRIRKVTAATGIITTFAGNGTSGSGGDDGPATAAQLREPFGVILDGSGNVYIADLVNNRIRKVTAATGIMTTIVGSGLYYPSGVVVDSVGNIYIADRNNHRVRKVTAATGVMTTIAGTGTSGFSGDGAAATGAQLYYPAKVAVDGAGNVYVADTNNHRIRKVTAATGIITTVAGTGTSGFSGDGGIATAAQVRFPYGVTLDGAGNMYIADSDNYRIRKVTALPYPPSSGTFSGSTDQGRAFSLTVDAGGLNVTQLSLNVEITNPAGCTVTITSNPAGNFPIGGNSFSYDSGATTCGSRLEVSGTFTSATAASGTLTATESNSGCPTVPKCPGTVTTAWSATSDSTRVIGLSGDLAFGTVMVDTTATRTLTISNTGNSTLAVSGITYPDGFSGAWSGTVAAGGSQNVTVTFAPTAVQSYSGTVTVASDKTSGANTIAASGTGTAVPTRVIALSGDLAFGTVMVDTTATRTLTINNTGNSTLTVSGITYPDGFSGAWSGTVAAGGSQNVTVTFAPTAVQSYSGTVTVASDKTSGTSTIAASGTAVPRVTPVITDLTPGSGPLGIGVTVTGTGFTGTTSVTFHAVTAAYAVVSDTQVTTTVPVGTTTGPVRVTTPGGTAMSATLFVVTNQWADRTLPGCYVPGYGVTVSIDVGPAPDVAVYAAEDRPPAGWTVGTISDGGAWDAPTGKVKWGPFFDATARVLTYVVTPPAETTGLLGFGEGIVSFDGAAVRVNHCCSHLINRCEQHPADANSDFRMAIGEVTGYGAAWKKGNTWAVPPAPIPIGYVTRAGYLWRMGETYRRDVGDGPLCWMPLTPSPRPESEAAPTPASGPAADRDEGPTAPQPARRVLGRGPWSSGLSAGSEVPASITRWILGSSSTPSPWSPGSSAGSEDPASMTRWSPGSSSTPSSPWSPGLSAGAEDPASMTGWSPGSSSTPSSPWSPGSLDPGVSASLTRRTRIGAATRQAPATYVPTVPLTVTLTVTPDGDVQTWAVEETVPAGWRVTAVSADGYWDEKAGVVRWGPFFDEVPQTLRYTLTPPAGASGPQELHGTASFDGVDVAVTGVRTLQRAPITRPGDPGGPGVSVPDPR
jgi:hypothetical protein